MDYYPKAYFILGLLFTGFGGMFLIIAIIANEVPSHHSYLMITLAVLSFSMSYLYPQFKQKDERMKLIRQKAMVYSYFAMMIYLIFFLVLLQLEGVSFSGQELIHLLLSLQISTIFLSMVILAKRY
ncbi:permease [Halobacillus salinarum]|uniref:Permease n=1 Tax=Halobacillus salinarum TaxID=2932257 RepID=A0ABY4ENA2_9BACI|nr:permease [Halobacillus salinarum]UOQ45939.1 permease [Halobacillus salinarum]